MTHLPVNEARANLAETIDKVCFGGERIVLHRRHKDVAALVSVEDLALLEELEDRMDLAEARRVLKESTKRTPYSEVRKRLGL